MHLTFSIVLVEKWILVMAFMSLKPELEDAFSVFNIFSKSSDFCKEVFEFLAKVMILVRRSDIFQKKC